MAFWAEEMRQQLNEGGDALTVLAQAMEKARANGHHFGSETITEALADLEDEVAELKQAVLEEKTDVRVRNEAGDVLFSLLNICQMQGVDLQKVSDALAGRWLDRKAFMERGLKEQNCDWHNCTDAMRTSLWQQAKKELKPTEEAQ